MDFKKKKPWLSPPVVFGGVACVLALTVWNVIRFSRAPDGFTQPEAVTYARIVTATGAIERFADSVGRLPASLSQLPIDQTGLSYVPDGDTFVLSANVDGTLVRHQRGAPLVPPDVSFSDIVRNAPR